MAKIRSFMKISGSIYGTTFRVDEGSNIAGEKSSLTKEKVETLEKFANTRRNDAEVKSAANAATLMLSLVTDAPKFHTTRRIYPHLVSIFVEMLREDTTGNTWGDRLPINGSFSHLFHFNYNEKATLASVMKASYTVVLDRVAGTATINIPSFTPTAKLVPPTGVSSSSTLYYRIFGIGAEADFTADTAIKDVQNTAWLPFDDTATSLINQVLTFTAGSVLPVFAILGVEWGILVGGNYIPLANVEANALTVVLSDKP